jgi:hypothetical protein
MLRPTKSVIIVLIISSLFGFIAGCESDAQNGALLGAVLGTGIAAIAGGDSDALLIGAGVGGGVGYVAGNESDKKKAKAERYNDSNEF